MDEIAAILALVVVHAGGEIRIPMSFLEELTADGKTAPNIERTSDQATGDLILRAVPK